MSDRAIVEEQKILYMLSMFGWQISEGQGRLMLAELLLKAGSGCYNSHTEEAFLAGFGLMKKDRTPNKAGRIFLRSMFYASSNRRPEAYRLMTEYRVD